ncbi:NUDIX domain-containing protein [Candidatus Poribacteria bacterium]|nr:NUDIX domain-containing protein [Candidatus Poribacteria bacterium]MYG08222.1 NUDIX domain-containing protein [Candidatus Poribacteria bacterium]MYK21789.1 NUDIX domain-containing protein [Candidatus Poribacteria bacterium]
MVQRIEEQDGYMFLHFGDPPENMGKIEFVNCVAHQQSQILFCKWRDNDIWVLPGGRVDPGETAEETAHRELLEETGATLKNLEVLCYVHCFMYDLEYWGIAYLGEIETLGTPSDLNEVSEAKLFSDFPENRFKQGPFANENRALYQAAMRVINSHISCKIFSYSVK